MKQLIQNSDYLFYFCDQTFMVIFETTFVESADWQ